MTKRRKYMTKKICMNLNTKIQMILKLSQGVLSSKSSKRRRSLLVSMLELLSSTSQLIKDYSKVLYRPSQQKKLINFLK